MKLPLQVSVSVQWT